ncbi:MAG: carboxypeptidase regulatory-like domain-containing protein [Acidobacteria bacterium]|nr:carboxypeptidase regulatory-like domain-containing protein [Acidobacteriota bacterium]
MKIVVTDEQGRYVLPDLPNADYRIWVRGYGLVDSPKVSSRPGRRLNLTAVPAPSATAAAEYYPANYWLSLMEVPPEEAFPRPAEVPPPVPQPPGTGASARSAGSGPQQVNPGVGRGRGQQTFNSQAEMLLSIKNLQQRQLGSKITREVPPQIRALGFTSTVDALLYGSTAGQMPDFGAGANGPNLFRMAVWVDRIAAGALPPQPPRPQGVERTVVVSIWDVSNEVPFIHDVVATDRRAPTLNAYGRVYGVEFHNDGLVELDPLEHRERTIPIPTQVPKSTIRSSAPAMRNPSIVWGEEVIYDGVTFANHLTMDEQGRVWLTARINTDANPPFCRAGSTNRHAQADPLDESTRHIAMYDPRTARWEMIRTCFRTHHIQMSTTGPRRVFTNPAAGGASGAYFGWIDVDVWEKTKDEEASQGWCVAYLDSDGDGRPNRDRPISGAPYSITQNPVDGSLWGAVQGTPGRLIRLSLGANPPATCVGEVYEVPFDPYPSRAPGVVSGFNPRGIDVDSTGVVWTALASSNHLASFDRRLCDLVAGEAATTGRHCAKGWKLYPLPGPKLRGVTAEIGSDFNYYGFVDLFNLLGLGRDTPIANGTISDSLMALDRRSGSIVTMRVPYPMGFYTRGMDGRIDDPDADWKGRGIWASNGTRNMWHVEGGKAGGGPGVRGHITKFQIRPTPLSK